jgi:hypothetical protein
MILSLFRKSSNNETDVAKKAAFKHFPSERGLPCCALQLDKRKLDAIILLSKLNTALKSWVVADIVLAFGR